MLNHFKKRATCSIINNTVKGYIMNNTTKPIWGMTHTFGVYVLWGRETPQSFETVLGEFETLESLKDYAEQHNKAHSWVSYRAGRI